MILVTGGLGYVGSHVALSLIRAGRDIVIVDNLENAHIEAHARLQTLAGKSIPFFRVDITDGAALRSVFRAHDFNAAVHLAGKKSPSQSLRQPQEYYGANVLGAHTLVEAMRERGVALMIFSSSATVYSPEARSPVSETAPLGPINPYGWSKFMIERMLLDLDAASDDFAAVMLRYFNPVGADKSGLIGEDPSGLPNNLFPYISQVAVGRLDRVRVFGGDYPTPDGTGVRDYIHVADLADAHVAALNIYEGRHAERQAKVYNVGSGRGYSVLEAIRAFEWASGCTIPYEVVERRPGDLADVVADPALANTALRWRASRGIEEMCADGWRWQSQNPDGYRGAHA
jgi:UDP-glucose 4-epimerase